MREHIVTVEGRAACNIAPAFLERFADDAAVMPRGALAASEVLIRGGDYYGPIVNQAARLARGSSRPRSLVQGFGSSPPASVC
jgi:hypothetical protein